MKLLTFFEAREFGASDKFLIVTLSDIAQEKIFRIVLRIGGSGE